MNGQDTFSINEDNFGNFRFSNSTRPSYAAFRDGINNQFSKHNESKKIETKSPENFKELLESHKFDDKLNVDDKVSQAKSNSMTRSTSLNKGINAVSNLAASLISNRVNNVSSPVKVLNHNNTLVNLISSGNKKSLLSPNTEKKRTKNNSCSSLNFFKNFNSQMHKNSILQNKIQATI